LYDCILMVVVNYTVRLFGLLERGRIQLHEADRHAMLNNITPRPN